MYLLDRVVSRAEEALARGVDPVAFVREEERAGVFSEEWVDLGGQLLPRARVDRLHEGVVQGHSEGLSALAAALDEALSRVGEDTWMWVRWAAERELGLQLAEASPDTLKNAAEELLVVRKKFLSLVLIDAGKEFDPLVQTGFGLDGGRDAVAADFKAVRGTKEGNSFVLEIQAEIVALERRVDRFLKSIRSLFP
jgi:hypothetical protein